MTEPIVRYGIAGTCGDGQGMLIEQHERIVAELQDRIAKLVELAGATYMMSGYHNFPERWMDAWSDAGNNMDFSVEGLLPYGGPSNDTTNHAASCSCETCKIQRLRQMVRTLLGITDVLDTADGWLVVRDSARKELEGR